MLAEIALNVLEISKNSEKAGATLIEVFILKDTSRNSITFRIKDNGKGMNEEQLASVTDPFFTSRTTRKVGLGIPFLKQGAEITGGNFRINSQVGIGTEVEATFMTDSIDCMPLGDINGTIFTLVREADEYDYVYTYGVDNNSFVLDTREIKEIVGGVSLMNNEISAFIRQFLDENMEEVDNASIRGE